MSYFSFLFPITSHYSFLLPFFFYYFPLLHCYFIFFISIFLLDHCHLLIFFIYCYCFFYCITSLKINTVIFFFKIENVGLKF
ncbi:hypothetical protein GLOIN_2v1626320 [Rhizophagus irregularis DAOM 181602=DAOM 197198]|nr:hypothetical protein GLOIN_2v1626320 [Rhizophagus irregularis DAOM 181602=DAOM 197198]GET65774.1 hypothetical protein GLOIN_2v1626320 [Rhizophagus irregularis DAOM 181602=DAOM 197198]GET65788.1 hypothetical protein GLOIN_2v1626320 [Rhizophagus irregularis DAOM 181602=DAOM 197198]